MIYYDHDRQLQRPTASYTALVLLSKSTRHLREPSASTPSMLGPTARTHMMTCFAFAEGLPGDVFATLTLSAFWYLHRARLRRSAVKTLAHVLIWACICGARSITKRAVVVTFAYDVGGVVRMDPFYLDDIQSVLRSRKRPSRTAHKAVLHMRWRLDVKLET